MNMIAKVSILFSITLAMLVFWYAFLWILPQNNAGEIFNPNPTGNNVVVGSWQKTQFGNYETRTIVTKNFYYTIYGDQKRELKPNAPIIGDTAFLRSELNKGNVTAVVSISIITVWIIAYLLFMWIPSKLKDNND